MWKRCKSDKGQIIGMHHAEKTFRDVAEATKTGLRTAQRIKKKWNFGNVIGEKISRHWSFWGN